MDPITPKVIFRTVARNAEATIARAIGSVLAQTYGNWELHLVDNASDDGTVAIMEEYSRKDPRIRVFKNDGNFVWREGNRFTDYYKNYDLSNTFLCYLDGDDEYKPDFLEKMAAFAEDNKLDIACCGYEYVNAADNSVIEARHIDAPLIVEGSGFDTHLTEYYIYMRSRCMKLFRLTITDKITASDDFDMLYGGDTVETAEYFRNAGRVGLCPETFYKYYVNPGSISHKWHYARINSDRLLFDLAKDFLIEKAGSVSHLNEIYLASVYLTAISSTTNVLLLSNETPQKKLEGLFDIYTSRHTQYLANIQIPAVHQKQREALFADTAGWIAAQKELRSPEYYDKIADIMYCMKYMPETLPDWSEQEIIGLFSVFSERYEEFKGIV